MSAFHATAATQRRPFGTTRRALAGALALPLLFGACGAGGSEATGGEAGAPVSGGTLRVGTALDLQPAIFYAMVFQNFNGNVTEALVDYSTEGLEPQPRLATSWEISPKGTSVRLVLREGVEFHNGKPLTPADVEHSIRAAADPANAAPIARSAAAITGFDVSKPGEITLQLAHPISNLFDVLAAVPIVESESAAGLKDISEVVGTGPFLFDSWTPGKGWTFVRNESYWGEPALLDEVEFAVIPDPQALVSQLRAGQIDVLSGAPLRDAQALEKDPNYDVVTVEGSGGGTYLGLNVSDPALKDVAVRRAIAHAIDQERIVEEVLLGYGRGGDLPWTSDSPIHDDALDQRYPYDLEAAAELVAEAGGPGIELPLSYPAENPSSAAIAQIIQADLAEVGVEVELTPRPQAELLSLGAVPGGIDGMWLSGHQWANFSPATIPVSAYAFNSEQNISGYSGKEYRDAARAAWATTPEKAASAGVYPALAEAFLDAAFVHEVVVSEGARVSSTSVEGLSTTRTSSLGLGSAWLSR